MSNLRHVKRIPLFSKGADSKLTAIRDRHCLSEDLNLAVELRTFYRGHSGMWSRSRLKKGGNGSKATQRRVARIENTVLKLINLISKSPDTVLLHIWGDRTGPEIDATLRSEDINALRGNLELLISACRVAKKSSGRPGTSKNPLARLAVQELVRLYELHAINTPRHMPLLRGGGGARMSFVRVTLPFLGLRLAESTIKTYLSPRRQPRTRTG